MRATDAAEQTTEDWLNTLTSVTLELARAVGAERWQAIGLSAMLPTLVPTDDAGAAATPRGAGVSRTWGRSHLRRPKPRPNGSNLGAHVGKHGRQPGSGRSRGLDL